jgi:hypothetical protein
MKIKCVICNKEFTEKGIGRHILNSHKITVKEYYDKYLKKKEEGICKNPSCNNKTRFISITRGYYKYCSNKCATNDEILKQKRKKTLLEKYGVENISQSSIIQERIRQTNLERYGVEYSSQNPEIKKRMNDTHNKTIQERGNEINEKRKQNNLQKWGVEWTTQFKEVKEKIKQTNLERYGVEHNSQNPQIQEKRKKSHNKTIQERGNEINEKRKQTNLEKYGVEYPTQFKAFIERSRETTIKSFRKKVVECLKEQHISLLDKNELVYTNDLIHLKCDICGREYINRWYNIQMGWGRCPKCFPRNAPSNGEKEITEFIESFGLETKSGDFDLIRPLQLDIVIKEKKVAIEYNGLYWHSFKNENYHLDKTIKCQEKGYQLIQIFEDEWMFKKDIVKSILKNILNINNSKRVSGRQCYIKEISPKDKNEFLNKFHLQGEDKSIIKLGAFFNDELVSVMTFSHGSISRGKLKSDLEWELSRYCSNYNYITPGVASKLLEHFKRNYKWNKIYTYADLRWTVGNLYRTLGFKFVHQTKPDYWYLDQTMIKRIHRFALRKKPDEPKDKTEWELRLNEGYKKIFDCGKIKYVLEKE